MSIFSMTPVWLRAAETPKPSRILSWFLSSRFSWIRTKAEQYYSNQVFLFRLKERIAIDEAATIEQAIRKNLNLDSSIAAIKHQLSYLEKANARMCEQIRTYPEVQHTLTLIYNELLGMLKPKPKVTPQKLPEFYKSILVKPKEAPKENLSDFNGAIEVNTPSPRNMLK